MRGDLFIRQWCALGGCLAWMLARALSVEWYVSPSGTSAGPGTAAQPYSLSRVLSGAVGQPGDTFWLRGGVYTLGHVNTRIQGAFGKPITLRGVPGEKPRIDGSLTIWDSAGYLVFRDFELFNSNPKRISSQTGVGFSPTDIQIVSGIACYSPRVSFINLVIHDHTRHGIYISEESADNLIYGCIIYNNGWRSPDNAEGHSLYIQGASGNREIAENILFNSAGAGMHVYENGGPPIVGVNLEGNVVFNSGAIQKVRSYRDWVLGADAPSPFADRIALKSNFGFLPPGSQAYSLVQVGRQGRNGSVVITDNYLPMGMVLNNWTSAIVSRNVLAPRNSDYVVDLQQTLCNLSASWDDNTYSRPSSGSAFRRNSSTYTFQAWKANTSYDQASNEIIGSLNSPMVFIRTNRFQAGRAHIVIYNWGNQDTVSVDLRPVLPVGKPFEIRDCQDFLGTPVLCGTFENKSLSLPTRGLSVAPPLGGLLTPAPTGPTFNVFVVQSLVTGSLEPPTIRVVDEGEPR